MKTLILLAMVMIAAQAYVLPEGDGTEMRPILVAEPGFGFSVGEIQVGDKLLFSHFVEFKAIPGKVQKKEVTFRTKQTISYAGGDELMGPKGATARVVRGGIGQKQVTFGFESAEGEGIAFAVRAWGS